MSARVEAIFPDKSVRFEAFAGRPGTCAGLMLAIGDDISVRLSLNLPGASLTVYPAPDALRRMAAALSATAREVERLERLRGVAA